LPHSPIAIASVPLPLSLTPTLPVTHEKNGHFWETSAEKIEYLPLSPFVSLQSHGIASVARTKREEMSMINGQGDLVGFLLQDFMRSLHPIVQF
jgi:hypothetical protein